MNSHKRNRTFSFSSFCYLLFVTLLFAVSSCSLEMGQKSPSLNTTEKISLISFPQFEPISVDNFEELEMIANLGYGRIHDIALSPGGKILAVSSPSGLHLYGTDTGEKILTSDPLTHEHTGTGNFPGQIAFNSDGTLIAVARNRADAPIQIMSLEGNQLTTQLALYEIPPGHQVSEMKFSLDSQQLFVQSIYSSASPKCGSPEIHYALHDLSSTPKNEYLLFDNVLFETRSCHYDAHTSRFTHDGKFLLHWPNGGYERSFLINAVTGEIFQEWGGTDHFNDKNVFDISPNGSIIAIYSDTNAASHPITLTDFENGEFISTVSLPLVFFLDQTRQVRELYSPETNTYKLSVWENEELTCTMDVDYFQAVDPTHSYLVTSDNWHFTIWDIAECEMFAQITHDVNDPFVGNNLMSAISSDNKYLALSSGETVQIWDFQLEKAFEINRPFPEEIDFSSHDNSISFVPNTHILALSIGEDILFFDVELWNLVETEIDPSYLDFTNYRNIVSTDGKLLISPVRNENRILFLAAENNSYLGNLEIYFQFSNIMFSTDGRLLIFIGADGILHIWAIKKE